MGHSLGLECLYLRCQAHGLYVQSHGAKTVFGESVDVGGPLLSLYLQGEKEGEGEPEVDIGIMIISH